MLSVQPSVTMGTAEVDVAPAAELRLACKVRVNDAVIREPGSDVPVLAERVEE